MLPINRRDACRPVGTLPTHRQAALGWKPGLQAPALVAAVAHLLHHRRQAQPSTLMSLDHIRPPPATLQSSDDDARAFLQERLAYFGRIYASIGITFYLVGNVAGFIGLPHDLGRRLSDPSTWVVPAASSLYFAQWLLLRRRRAFSYAELRAIDGATTILAAVCQPGLLDAA